MASDSSINTIGNFYQIDVEGDNVVATHGGSRLVLARWALKRHQQQQNKDIVCAGRRVLEKTLGMSRRQAMRTLDDLRSIALGPEWDQRVLIDATEWNEQCDPDGKVPPGPYKANKVMPLHGERLVPLPNQLNEVHKGQDKCPLQQLFEIRDSTLRDDCVYLLRGLYEHLDMKRCGGADPYESMYFLWRKEGRAPIDEGDTVNLGYLGCDDGLHFWAVDTRIYDIYDWRESLMMDQSSFVSDVTGEWPGDSLFRLMTAFNHLCEIGLLYHAAIVFDGDPTQDGHAQMLYPLWVFSSSERDRLKRQGTGQEGLAVPAIEKARKVNVNEEFTEILDHAASSRFYMDDPLGFFVFAADTKDAEVVGIIRPRFIPNTMDSQAGWSELSEKAKEWHAKLA